MIKETSNARRYFSRNYKSDDPVPYSWYNTEYYKLTDKGRQELKDYIVQRPYIREIIVVSNVEVTRPQRTWGDMPEWFRPASAFRYFDGNNHSNSFIFIIYDKDYEEADILEAFKSFPDNAEINYIRRIYDAKDKDKM